MNRWQSALHKRSFRGSAAFLAVSLWFATRCAISSRLRRTLGEALPKESSFGKPKAYRKRCGRAGNPPIDFLCRAGGSPTAPLLIVRLFRGEFVETQSRIALLKNARPP